MGLNRLTEICRQLMAAGMPETTPAAVVCHASLATQQVVEGTLATIPHEASGGQLKPPSLIVVGECIRQRAQLSWFEQLPLFGVSIGVTRPEEQADDVASQIVRMGGEPVIMPMIEIGPVAETEVPAIQEVLERLHEFQWLVFTSVNGVSEFFRHLQASGRDTRALHAARIAAIGTSTASKLESFGIQADFVPAEFRAESLGTALADRAQGQTVLWVRASRGRDVLPKLLQDAGVRLEQLVVYENRDVAAFSSDVVARLRSGTLQWVGLSSPSISRQFSQLLKTAEISPAELKTKIAAISSVTARAAEDCGLTVQCIARNSTWDGILDAIVLSHQSQSPRS
jgi:uroporphyrinogen III methyltransferase/synthase